MILKQVVSGAQPYKIVFIEDSFDEQANTIIRCFVNEGINCGKEVHLLCFDHFPSDVEKKFNLQRSGKLYLHDFFSDPAGWLSEPNAKTDFTKEDVFSSVKKSSVDSSGLLVIIDSISSFIISHGLPEVYKQIHRFINSDFNKGDVPRQLVSLLYPDALISYDTSVLQLRHLSTVWVTVSSRSNVPGKTLVKIEQKKNNAKLAKQFEECWIDSQCLFQSRKIDITKESVVRCENNELPSQLTTFNLGLKDEEKEARSKLVLPYLKNEKSGSGGTIYYEPDENDDWDEEDPDDDLDI